MNRILGKSLRAISSGHLAAEDRTDHPVGISDIQFGLDPEPFAFLHREMNDAEGAGLIGGIKGLQIGKVVQLQDDPDGQHRILVKIPVINNDGRGTWMRMASLDAGSDRGAFFRPEIDDEVIVGFIEDNPLHAVILGCLHSSKNASPITPDKDNYKKGFYSREKLKWEIDEEKKEMELQIPDWLYYVIEK